MVLSFLKCRAITDLDQRYRQFYLPNLEQAKNWDASPLLAPNDLMAKTTKAWIAVGELDILRDEAKAYHQRLEETGNVSTLKEYAGTTHSLMLLPGVSARSREMVQDARSFSLVNCQDETDICNSGSFEGRYWAVISCCIAA